MTYTRLDVRDASAHMLAGAKSTSTETVALEQSLGRFLALDVVAEVSLPPWDNASMDGFAVRAADVRGASTERPVRLSVVATVAAGKRTERAVASGEAVRIMTGAPVPHGADSIVRVEDTDGGDRSEMVTITDDRDAQRNIRLSGEDVRSGACVMTRGVEINAPRLGVLASLGHAQVTVFRRPRVAILATGDEIVPVEKFDAVRRGERIVSSNSYALAAAVREAGGEPVPLGIAPDDPAALARALRAADGCDLVLTTGGVSVGDFDYTRRVVAELGGTLSLWRVRMRPGAPLGFGTLFGVPWLGLPGNPVSALVTFELFGRPLVRTMTGSTRPHRRTLGVITSDPITLNAPLTHLLRVTLDEEHDDRPVARLTGTQSSGMLTSMAVAHALLVVPPESSHVAVGTILRALPLHGDWGGSATFLA